MSPGYWRRNSDQHQLLFGKKVSLKNQEPGTVGTSPCGLQPLGDEPVELGNASQGGIPRAAFEGQSDFTLETKNGN